MARQLAEDAVEAAFARRVSPGRALADDAERMAQACHDMAVHFHGGGKLIVFGNGGAATDAQHVVVEFVHPVIVGKRALPAISLTNDPATLTGIARTDGFDEVFAAQLHLLATPQDIALGISADGGCGNVLRALETAKDLGLLTVALLGGDGGDIARSGKVDHVCRGAVGGPLRGQGGARDRLPHPLGAGARVLRAARAVGSGGDPMTAQDLPQPVRRPEVIIPDCYGEVCITCSDEAVPVRVHELREDGLAVVETEAGLEVVSVALVDTAPGDVVLVHAKEALAVIERPA